MLHAVALLLNCSALRVLHVARILYGALLCCTRWLLQIERPCACIREIAALTVAQ
jgi:hypothetical protein